MNNLVFNTTAKNLKTALYAQAPDESFQPVQLNASNQLEVGGTVTVSEITNPITIANDTLTVAGTVTVSEITNPITIANSTLTVAGTVTVSEITNPITIANDTLTVAGTVTVSEITNPVTTIGSFDEDTETATDVTGEGFLFANEDVSTYKEVSLFVYNDGANPITVSLQFSPTTDTDDYMDDESYTDNVIAAGEKLFIPHTNLAHYIRLSYDVGAETTTIRAYLNMQG